MGAIHQALLSVSAPSGGGVSDFDPTGILWRIRAADITGFVDNDVINTNWLDTSGNGRHWSPNNTPRYRTNVINGHPVVRFSQGGSGNDWFAGPNLSGLGLTEIDLFMLVKMTNDPAASSTASGFWHNNNPHVQGATHFPFTDGVIYMGAHIVTSTDSRVAVNPTPSLAAWRLLRVTAKTGTNNYTIDLDGVNIATATRNNLVFTSDNRLGESRNDSTGFYLSGDVAEYFAFSVKRDATQTTEIHDYLDSFYATSLP